MRRREGRGKTLSRIILYVWCFRTPRSKLEGCRKSKRSRREAYMMELDEGEGEKGEEQEEAECVEEACAWEDRSPES